MSHYDDLYEEHANDVRLKQAMYKRVSEERQELRVRVESLENEVQDLHYALQDMRDYIDSEISALYR